MRGVETVERKGRAHPDTLSDAAAEATELMRLIHVGRATQALEGTGLDLEALATASARAVFGRSLRHLGGTSAEAGDDGQVGRGNRANGLITPSRPMRLEAVAGKNPVSHVGKLYNTWAQQLTTELAARPDIAAVSCQLASRIGAPITEPQVVWLGACGPAARDASGLAAYVRTALERLPAMWRELLHVGWQVA